jgi:hypothetical protein
LQATKVGCDSSRIHLQKIDKHWTMDTKTQVKDSPTFVANQNGKIGNLGQIMLQHHIEDTFHTITHMYLHMENCEGCKSFR